MMVMMVHGGAAMDAIQVMVVKRWTRRAICRVRDMDVDMVMLAVNFGYR